MRKISWIFALLLTIMMAVGCNCKPSWQKDFEEDEAWNRMMDKELKEMKEGVEEWEEDLKKSERPKKKKHKYQLDTSELTPEEKAAGRNIKSDDLPPMGIVD